MPRILLLTDQRWVPSKVPALYDLLSLCPDLRDVEIAIKFKELVPEVKDGRIVESWFQENITSHTEGNLGVILIASEAQGKKWSLKDGLRGSHFRDGDKVIEGWAVSNERSTIRFKDRSKRDRLPKVIAHELGHGFKELGLTELEIHDYDYETSVNNIEGFYKRLRLRKPSPLAEMVKVAIPVALNRQEHLYKVAYDCLGKDMAKTQQELGCAESVTAVLRLAGVKGLPLQDITGTYTLNEWLKKNFKQVTETEARPGDVIMSATGTGNGKIPNGHTGILGVHSIMSNNYKTYLWDWHLQLQWWKDYYGKKGGFPVLFYRW